MEDIRLSRKVKLISKRESSATLRSRTTSDTSKRIARMATERKICKTNVQPPPIPQSSWRTLLDEACKSGTKLKTDPLTLTHLMGWYSLVGCDFNDLSNYKTREEAWLSIIAPSRPGALSPFAYGQFRLWWEMANIDTYKRDKWETTNFWLLNGITWSAEPIVIAESKNANTDTYRSIEGCGIAVLSTLDDNDCPFLEMISTTGGKEGNVTYTHLLWRRGHNSRVTLQEIRRLAEDGVTSSADPSGSSQSSGFVGKGKVLMTRKPGIIDGVETSSYPPHHFLKGEMSS